MRRVSAQAPTNIAVIKYWGKSNPELNIPLNSSLSVTLNPDHMCTTTTVTASRDFLVDNMWLNGQEVGVNNVRTRRVLIEMRALSKSTFMIDVGDAPDDASKTEKRDLGRRIKKPKLVDGNTPFVGQQSDQIDMFMWCLQIRTENNFPTAAGLASSASGYACLVYALDALYNLRLSPQRMSAVARLGSGSACRSLMGGFVVWDKGRKQDGSDSVARQVAPSEHWPDFRILVVVVTVDKKKTPSTSGMADSVTSSDLLRYRARYVVPKRIFVAKSAISRRDYISLTETVMRESNQLHAICQDTYPPIVYLNNVSRSLISLIHTIRTNTSDRRVCYTFDAGPNAIIFLHESLVSLVVLALKTMFGCEENDESFVRGLPVDDDVDDAYWASLRDELPCGVPGGVQFLIHTNVGEGARIVHDIMV